MGAKYRRILLKVSGEVLAGDKKTGIDFEKVNETANVIRRVREQGVEVAIVVGGGNFWRGRSSGEMDRTRADQMGMLATVLNALALQDELEKLGVPAEVFNGLDIQRVGRPFNKFEAVKALEDNKVVIFGCGTGNPFFTTDTGAALRASEIGADIFFKATNVDGVNDKDPNKYADAVKYDTITFDEILEKRLNVMDNTAAAMALNNHLPVLVFNLNDPENVIRAVEGEAIGTVVTF